MRPVRLLGEDLVHCLTSQEQVRVYVRVLRYSARL